MRLKKTVFVNGCFDVLHPGHLALLEEATKHGDNVIVGLNSDESVKALKSGRLARSFEERKLMLEACRFVDLVVCFTGVTASNLVDTLKPDTYVTGDEYRGRSPEAKIVKDYGGKVVYFMRVGKYSSSMTGASNAAT